MALSPLKALSQSPGARLTDEERANVDRFENACDEFMATIWNGGAFTMNTTARELALSHKEIAAIVRKYSTPDRTGSAWDVQPMPLDGALGKAMELLAAGARVYWTITLIPKWAAAPALHSVH